MTTIFGVVFWAAACWYAYRYLKADFANTVENRAAYKQFYTVDTAKVEPNVEPAKSMAIVKNDVKPIKPKATTKKATQTKSKTRKADDFTRFSGVGAKIDTLLKKNRISTYKQFAEADVDKLTTILQKAGVRVRNDDPKSWKKQATLAAAANWKGLEKLQNKLNKERKGNMAKAA